MSGEAAADFWRRWRIREPSVLGSVLRDDLGPRSDTDLLAKLAGEAPWSLLDLVSAAGEASAVLGRPVDLVERSAVERSRNRLRDEEVLRTARPVKRDEARLRPPVPQG